MHLSVDVSVICVNIAVFLSLQKFYLKYNINHTLIPLMELTDRQTDRPTDGQIFSFSSTVLIDKF